MIFIVNKDCPWYLPYVARQVELSNGAGSLVLVLDKTYEELSHFKILEMKDHSSLADEFGLHYRSLFEADQYHVYELIWFQRYMYVLEYLDKKEFSGDFWILDSDVLVYSDLKNVEIPLGKRFTRLKEQDPCFSWFANRYILRQFCDYMLHSYQYEFDELERYFYENYGEGKLRGGVCEMTFLKWFAEQNLPACHDLTIPINGWAFDRGLHVADGYRRDVLGGKRVLWDAGRPYGVLQDKRVNFHGLHLQGSYKNLIPLFFSGESEVEDRRRATAWLRREWLRKAPRNLATSLLNVARH